jgi:hypothetical protein
MTMKKPVYLLLIVLFVFILGACAKATQIPPTTAPTQTQIPPKPTLTPFPVRGIIGPGDKIGEMTMEREASMHYYRLIDACDFDWTINKPHSQTVECTLPELSVVGVNFGWPAHKTKFKSCWDALSWELYIDDYQIALNQFSWEDLDFFDPESATEITYRSWNVILKNLSAGRHTIRFSFSTEVSIEDGWDIYPPGRYEYIANMTVTEKPNYPTLSSAANPGQHAFTSQKANLDFLLYLPEDYGKEPETKWPLIIYLHDAEWRGTSPEILRGEFNPEYMIVSLPKVLETRKDLPFIVLSPVGNGGWQFWATDEMITPLITLVEEIQSFYSVDSKRIYLTGSGMGGNGVWAIGLRHPEVFAALAPLDGYLNYPYAVPENICDLKDVPVWAFHGRNDFMVPVEVEQELVDALNACGGNAQYTVKPGVVIPGEIYAQSELYEWFLLQSKK